MSDLRVAAEEYVAIRRSTGFKFEQAAKLLSDFVRHLENDGSRVITSAAAISWASGVGGHPNWWGKRLSVVRGFARYLRGLEPGHEAPPLGLFPTRPCRATPYLYSDEDVVRLMMAARSLRASWGRTMETLIGLLASTGMRVGEAIHLDVTDIDWEGGVLVVRSTKFGKSREVALHATTVEALRAYHDERHRVASQLRTTTFFVSTRGNRLHYDSVHTTFHRLAGQLGLSRLTEHHGPRLHDLRHTFAVRTLLDWYRSGMDVGRRLHLLSTYLGHVDPAATYWYLTAAPELLALAARRLEPDGGDPS
jgi:integrase